jgi:glucosamine--fructose-6-phosphate aminotransferase (isomerizing)
MCGIVGYVGGRDATAVLIGGLRRLEYRGYDSAGVAVSNGQGAKVVRCRGKLAALESLLAQDRPQGALGIGHTRWATHGRPSDENAHPHKAGPVSVVHNGIIENHVELRARLAAAGHTFSSETDTEIVAHLIQEALTNDAPSLVEAVRIALRQVEGAYALVVLSDDHEGELIAAKTASPLVVGLGENEMFLASDAPAILEYTKEVMFLEDGDIARLTREGVSITDLAGKPLDRKSKTITWSVAEAEKAGYPHFMLKEIHEQPRALTDTLRGRLMVDGNDALLDDLDISRVPRRVVLLACGTSYHAGLGRQVPGRGAARLPCEVDLASEFRYRDPVVGPDDLVVGHLPER